VFHYPCPCGDRFEISRKQLSNYEDVAMCPSCSLIIRVIYDPLDFEDEPPDEEGDDTAATREEDEDEDSDDSDEQVAFEDAMENLTISEGPRLVAATA